MRPCARALALALAIGLVPAPLAAHGLGPVVDAPARTRPRVAVAPVRVLGEIGEIARAQMDAQVRAGLGQSAIDVLSADPRIAECSGLECLVRAASADAASHVVQAEIAVDDKVYEVHVVAHDVRTKAIAAEVRETCEVCGIAEVADLVRRQSAALGERIATLAPTPAVLAVRSNPSGAAIALDDAPVGPAPLRLELEAGPHRLRATLDGYAAMEHRIVAVEGVHETWSFALRRTPPSRRHRAARIAGWTLLGIGSAAIVPGVVFLAIDDRPYRARCSGGDQDGDGDCRFLYRSVIHGAVLTAVGLALVAAGIGLVVGTRRARVRGDVARR